MLSSLLRPKKNRQHVEEASVFTTPYEQRRHATADFTEDDGEDEESEEEEDEEDIDEEDGGNDSPLLPIFSAAHLGMFQQGLQPSC